ncbi:DNA2/NAM7 family helicase [Neobacillus sp. MM2021_6]|uniref:DEAD/DEAH box helicase n=1 Tax=Bacillaceae TaxID=186817 RepID=UPI0014085805|nr:MULTISPECIES: DEAD/DEAH box helicase [Bacillaceae]MBO0960012.1 DNA2/NAM7 family helicase [Neobacillus sp. MM2021_6]NHC18666.1 AAA family ATPase [Bacillus sp. MM2020_4]
MKVFDFLPKVSGDGVEFVKGVLHYFTNVVECEIYPHRESPFMKIKNINPDAGTVIQFVRNKQKIIHEVEENVYLKKMEYWDYCVVLRDEADTEIWLGDMRVHEIKEILLLLGVKTKVEIKNRNTHYHLKDLKPNHDIKILVFDEEDQARFVATFEFSAAAKRYQFLNHINQFARLIAFLKEEDYQKITHELFPEHTRLALTFDEDVYAINFKCRLNDCPRIVDAYDLWESFKQLGWKYCGKGKFHLEEFDIPALASPQVQQKLSVSAISTYFLTACDRQLFLNSFSDVNLKKNFGIDPHYLHSKKTKEGFTWEATVLSEITRKELFYANSKLDPVSDVTQQLKKFLSIRHKIVSGGKEILPFYIYSSTSEVPKRFYKTYKTEQEIPRIKPIEIDLVEITKDENAEKYKLTVIDMKSNEEVKPTHKIQVTLYSMILQELLLHDRELNEHFYIDMSENGVGGVWTKKDLTTYQPFDLAPVRDVILSFFQKEMTSILEVDDYLSLHFHLGSVCEGCKFFAHCKGEVLEKDHLSKIQGFSPFASDLLREWQEKQEFAVESNHYPSIQALEHILVTNPSLLEKSESFKHRANNLKTEIKALRENRGFLLKKEIFDLPKEVENHLFVSIQRESINGTFYGALFITNRTFSGEQLSFIIPEHYQNPLPYYENFIIQLHDYLEKNKESTHFYFYEKSEQIHFIHLICEVVKGTKDELIKEKAQQILFLFYSSKFLALGGLTATQTLEKIVPFPFTIVGDFVRRNFALPIPIKYSLENVTEFFGRFHSSPFPPVYKVYRNEQCLFTEMTDTMKPDTVYEYWEATDSHQKEKALQQMMTILEDRLRGCQFVVYMVEREKNLKLKRSPQSIEFSPIQKYDDELSTKLAFITKFEAFSQFHELKLSRQQPLIEQAERGYSLQVEFIQDDGVTAVYRVMNKEYMYKMEPFFVYKFSDGSPNSLEELNQMVDANLKKPKPKEIDHDHYLVYFNSADIEAPFLKKGTYYISPVFYDSVSAKIVEYIHQCDANPAVSYQLIKDPLTYNQPYAETLSDLEKKVLVSTTRFTEKQLQAYEHLISNKLTLLFGPPGTGKTTFIANSVLYYSKKLLEKAEQKNKTVRPFRILLTAQTHSAIENGLEKMIKFMSTKSGFKHLSLHAQVGLCKFGGLRSNDKESFTKHAFFSDIFYDKQLDRNYFGQFARYEEFLDQYPVTITGGTLIQVFNLKKRINWLEYDMVIMDEASQVKIPESLIAVGAVKQDGHLLLVGDHYQLPPVFTVDFEEEEKFVTHSLFSYLIEAKKMKPSQLIDNFRMNNVISGFSAEKLYNQYGDSYKAFDVNIAHQVLDPISVNIDYLQDMLTPEAPFTLCMLEGIQTGRENEEEANLIMQLVLQLANYYDGYCKTTRKYKEDLWWDKERDEPRLFIVCPHKAQIRLIKEKLDEKNIPHPLIDTAEKAQGKEAEIVLISYGISDYELAHKELDFIYSLNRLNVSLTRAKKKVINFIPQKLFTPTYASLLEDKNIENLRFFLGLRTYVNPNYRKYTKIDDSSISLKIYHKFDESLQNSKQEQKGKEGSMPLISEKI